MKFTTLRRLNKIFAIPEQSNEELLLEAETATHKAEKHVDEAASSRRGAPVSEERKKELMMVFELGEARRRRELVQLNKGPESGLLYIQGRLRSPAPSPSTSESSLFAAPSASDVFPSQLAWVSSLRRATNISDLSSES